jgi:recombinational DNA repair ATPase RecF
MLIQGVKTTRPRYMAALEWRTVHISPFDMNLLYFAPQMRRDYLDLILSRTYAQFPQVKKSYDTAMRQRNALLKQIREGMARREDLDFWDDQFAQVAEAYGLYRTRYVAFVRDNMSRFPAFFARYAPEFCYQGSVETARQDV